MSSQRIIKESLKTEENSTHAGYSVKQTKIRRLTEKKKTQIYNSVFLMSTAHFFPTDNGSIVQCIDIMKNIAICNFLKMERNL